MHVFVLSSVLRTQFSHDGYNSLRLDKNKIKQPWQSPSQMTPEVGSGDGSVLERRICDRKFSGLSPGRSGGRGFVVVVVLTHLSIRSTDGRVTAVAHKRS